MKRLPKQTYTLEFKQAAIQRMEVAGKKQADVAQELGLANTGHVPRVRRAPQARNVPARDGFEKFP
jgi:transposase-like protein